MENFQYPCPFAGCNKAFKVKKSIKEHMRIHQGEKPYNCHYPGCKKSFTQYSSMQKHERTHSGVKPYKCNLCGMEFTQISNLKRHERVHAGEKKFNCEICQKKFSTASNLGQHMSIHKKGDVREKYTCNVCFRVYCYQSSLRKHLHEHEEEGPFSSTKDSNNTCKPSADCSFQVQAKPDSRFEDMIYGVHDEAEQQSLKNDEYFMEPDLIKYIFVDNSQTIKSPAIDFKYDSDKMQELISESSKTPKPDHISSPKNTSELFPNSPYAYLYKPQCDPNPQPLPLSPLLDLPIRDPPELAEFPQFNSREKIFSCLIRYKGEIYYLYDRTLNRYKPNGELIVTQIENDATNPSICNHLFEQKNSDSFDCKSSNADCNEWNTNANFLQSDNIESPSRLIEYDFLASPKLLIQPDNFSKLSYEKSIFGSERSFQEQHSICAREVDKSLKHVHGAYCGHPAIFHDGHVDYIVDGRLQHPDGDHCDDHGPISVLQSPDEEYAYGFISNTMHLGYKTNAPAPKYRF